MDSRWAPGGVAERFRRRASFGVHAIIYRADGAGGWPKLYENIVQPSVDLGPSKEIDVNGIFAPGGSLWFQVGAYCSADPVPWRYGNYFVHID